MGGADLSRVDLSGTFHKALPWEVYQETVDIAWENIAAQFGANLSGAHLWGAILNRADLSRACLHAANLRAADLRAADLSGANLREANLRAANLREADLDGAIVTAEQLAKARTLQGATMPDGKIHD